jgi:hypothetical protein
VRLRCACSLFCVFLVIVIVIVTVVNDLERDEHTLIRCRKTNRGGNIDWVTLPVNDEANNSSRV